MTKILDLPRDIWFLIIDFLLLTIYNEIIEDKHLNFRWHRQPKKKKQFKIQNSCGLGRTCRTIYNYLKEFEKIVLNRPIDMQIYQNKIITRFDFDAPAAELIKQLAKEEFFSKMVSGKKYNSSKRGHFNNEIIKKHRCENIVILRGEKEQKVSNISMLMFRRYWGYNRFCLFRQVIDVSFNRGEIYNNFYISNDRMLMVKFESLFKDKKSVKYDDMFVSHIATPGGPIALVLISWLKNKNIRHDVLYCNKKNEIQLISQKRIFVTDVNKYYFDMDNEYVFGRNTIREIGFRLMNFIEVLKAAELEEKTYDDLRRLVKYAFIDVKKDIN